MSTVFEPVVSNVVAENGTANGNGNGAGTSRKRDIKPIAVPWMSLSINIVSANFMSEVKSFAIEKFIFIQQKNSISKIKFYF